MLNKLQTLFMVSVASTSLAVHGSTSITSLNNSTKGSVKKDSQLTGDFGFQTNDIVDGVGEVTGNKHFGSLNIKYQSFNSDSVYKGLDITSQINDEEVLQYSVKEAVLEFRSTSSRFAMGRATLDWSEADSVWGLGKLNNRVNFDYFEPGQEGLVGFFYDKKFDNGFEIGVFGSFLYVPELNQGLIVDKKNGTVICKTAWCEAPASSARIENRDVPIFYDVNYPDIEDVIVRSSFGWKLGYTYEKFHMNTFIIRKPENTMSVIAEVSVEPDLTEISAEITLQFYLHDVSGGNLELSLSDEFKLYGSIINIVPKRYPDTNEPFIEYTGIRPKKKRENYISGGAEFGEGNLIVRTDYIARISEFDTESDILVDYPRWNQALHLAVSKKLSRTISVALDYKYDMLTEDRLTMVKTDYSFGPGVVATLGMKMIGTNPSKESYWSKFENNDSVYSSLKYRF